jgi:hypothetical protein
MRPRTRAQLEDPVRVAKAARNPGAQPKVLRELLRETVAKQARLLDEIIAEPTMGPDARLRAFDLACKYGLGTNQNLTTGADEDQPVQGVIVLPELDLSGLQREREAQTKRTRGG